MKKHIGKDLPYVKPVDDKGRCEGKILKDGGIEVVRKKGLKGKNAHIYENQFKDDSLRGSDGCTVHGCS